MLPADSAKIRCRQIADSDLEAVAGLLSRGFPGRSERYWAQGLQRLRTRDLPEGFPRYGYVLLADEKPVGCVLLLFAAAVVDGEAQARCNLSSWYVEPEFRGYASQLVFVALRHKQATYVNISPAPHTWPTVEAQGFVRYCSGLFFALPFLNRGIVGAKVRAIGPETPPAEFAALPERDLLVAHAGYGCLSLVCRTPAGDHPFVFTPLRIRNGRIRLPGMRLVYCRDIADFVHCAAPLGRYLFRRGAPVVVLDSNGPVEGLYGLYTEASGRKYFRGKVAPRLGDLANSELVLFGP